MGILKTNNAQITLMDTIHKYICANIRKNIDLSKKRKIIKCKPMPKSRMGEWEI